MSRPFAGMHRRGTHSSAAAAILRPLSTDELADRVSTSARVWALGTRHSFDDVADGPGVLVDMTRLSADIRT